DLELKWNSLGMAEYVRAVVIEDETHRASRTALLNAALYLQKMGFVTDRVEAATTTWSGIIDVHPDVVLLSTGASGKPSRLIADLKQHRAAISVTCVLVAAKSPKSISLAYTCGATVVAPAEVFANAVRNVIIAPSAISVETPVQVTVPVSGSMT